MHQKYENLCTFGYLLFKSFKFKLLSLHHFIILLTFYFPYQGWKGGWSFFLVVMKGNVKKLCVINEGGIWKSYPFKKYPLPPSPALQYK